MAHLIYLAIMSLDGYIEDKSGNFGWAEPDPQVHAFVNDLVRPIGTYLYGRRMYEVMSAWETDVTVADQSAVSRDFAEIWRRAEKIVYSRTLETVSTAKTRVEREFDLDALRRLKGDEARDLAVGGPELAAHAFKAGLVDECQLFAAPVIVGGGKRALPEGVFVNLELIDQRRFDGGFVHMRYRTRQKWVRHG